jgi:N-acyl-D-amino-acid deacylase
MIKMNRCAVCFFALLALSFSVASGLVADDAAYDLVIQNARVVDGTGNPAFFADIGICNGRIAKLEYRTHLMGRETLDATGLIVAPGFIDVHTHVDSEIFRQPHAENFIRDGVTTVITGNCGGSVGDVGAYLDRLTSQGTAINIGTLIGQNTVRRSIMGLSDRQPTADDMHQMKALIRKAMEDGAVGMSTGLIYLPGTYSTTDELIELMKTAAADGGIYATHMRSEGPEILEAIDEALRIGKEAGCRVEISRFKIGNDNTIGGAPTILKRADDARARGLDVTMDQYPYTASSSGLSILLPDWVLEGGREKALERLRDPELQRKIIKEMLTYYTVKRHRPDFSYAVFSQYSADPSLVGKNILEITTMRRKKSLFHLLIDRKPSLREQIETIIDLYVAGNGSMVYHTMDEKDVREIMQHPCVMICSDSGIRSYGEGMPHPRGYGANARVLGHYVRELRLLTLEEAIRKMTSLPAQSFWIRDRGMIREGNWADLTLFDPEKITSQATYDAPHRYADGIPYVFVNGVAVVKEGKATEALPGKPIYGPGKAP